MVHQVPEPKAARACAPCMYTHVHPPRGGHVHCMHTQVPELKAALAAKGLETGGKKAQLVERLLAGC